MSEAIVPGPAMDAGAKKTDEMVGIMIAVATITVVAIAIAGLTTADASTAETSAADVEFFPAQARCCH